MNGNTLDIKYKIVRDGAKPPVYATDGSAAADISACLDAPVTLEPGEIKVIPTGIAISPQAPGIVALVYGRSGLGTKYGVTLANSVGVVDNDYRGEINVALINRGKSAYTVNPGDRIAQIMFAPFYTASFIKSDDLDETARGKGGFGSTGK